MRLRLPSDSENQLLSGSQPGEELASPQGWGSASPTRGGAEYTPPLSLMGMERMSPAGPSPRPFMGPVTSSRSMRHFSGSMRQTGTFPPTSAQNARLSVGAPSDASMFMVGSLPVEGTFYASSPTVSEGGDRLTSLRGAPFSHALDATLHAPLNPRTFSDASSSGGDSGSRGGSTRDPRRFETAPAGSDPPLTAAEPPTTAVHDITFGLILASMEIPCMIGYAQIIFKDSFFAEDMHDLLKLVLFSCMVHQASFMIASRLPFAIGSVQDAGLIFLSTMSSTIVQSCSAEGGLKPGLTRDDVLITTVFTLAAR